jgi:hypothetical protein
VQALGTVLRYENKSELLTKKGPVFSTAIGEPNGTCPKIMIMGWGSCA